MHCSSPQVVMKVLYAGVNGGHESFRTHAMPYTPCGPPFDIAFMWT